MSDHERGAYTPPTADAPLSFDPRQPVRGARPIPFTLILSVLVLAGLVAAIFMFYQSGVRRAGEAPQTVGAPVAGIKSPPPADAQPQDAAAGLQIYRSENGGPVETVPAPPKFAPPPEQPQARPTTPVTVAPAPPVAAAPSPAAQASTPATALKPAAPPAAAPAAKAPAAEAAPKPEPQLKVAAATPPPKAVMPAPELKKAAPVEAKKSEAKAAEAKKAEAKPAAPAAGGAAVQIGAVSSTALANKAWSDAVAVAPGLAAGKGKSVEKIEKNGATLYRTAVTGFASRADAQAFCAKLTAAGKSCFVR